jgi:hypothetical protein
VLLLLAGCQNLFGLRSVPTSDGHAAADAARDAAMGSADAPADAIVVLDAIKPLPSLVQQASSSNDGIGLDVTMQSRPNTGDTLIVVGGATCGLATISGGGVAVWQLVADSEVSPTNMLMVGVTDGSSSSLHLVPKCTTQTWGLVSEWTSLAAVPADASNHQGMVTSVAGTLDIAVTEPNAPDLLVLGVSSYGALGSPSAAWTEMDPIMAGSITQRTWYQLAAATGQHTADVSINSDYDATIAAFRSQ